MKTLIQSHDCVLMSLDGTVWRGDAPTDGAVDALSGSVARALFVTDDASYSPSEIAIRLCGYGIVTTSRDIVTSGLSVAALVAELHGAGARVLVVGDRLDTDVAGANAAGLPSMLVLTGVSTATDVVAASPEQRPTYVTRDLRGLHEPADEVAVATQPAWHAEIGRAAVTVSSTGVDPGADGLSVVRAVAYAVWDNVFDVPMPVVHPGDDAAWMALHRWSLLPEAESVRGRVRPASGPRSSQPSRTPA